MGSYTTWSLNIGFHAYKDIIPQHMSLEAEYETSVVEQKLFYKRFEKKPTGRTVIVFSYTRTPRGEQLEDRIPFESREEAVAWHKYIFERVFLNKESAKFVPPPTKPKGPNLRLV